MKNYYIRKILNNDQLKEVKNVIDFSNKNNCWVDGLESNIGATKKTKNNLELSDINGLKTINNIIMNQLDSDKSFYDFTVPETTAVNIVSRTDSGGFYAPHVDNWSNGDYSTTVFLNSPTEYVGGELCLYFGGEDEIKIKLDSGWAITYPTGILHRVNKVSSGSRYASVFWTKSRIKDSFIRQIYSEIGNIEDNIINNNDVYINTCYNSLRDISFCIRNLKDQILRVYSKN